eukprot:EG_transcript_8309
MGGAAPSAQRPPPVAVQQPAPSEAQACQRKSSGVLPRAVDAPQEATGCCINLMDVPATVNQQRIADALADLDVHPERIKLQGAGVVELYFPTDGAAKPLTQIPFFFLCGKRVRIGLPRKEGQKESPLLSPQAASHKASPDMQSLANLSEPVMRHMLRKRAAELPEAVAYVYLPDLPPSATEAQLVACLEASLQIPFRTVRISRGPPVTGAVSFLKKDDADRLLQVPFFSLGGKKIKPRSLEEHRASGGVTIPGMDGAAAQQAAPRTAQRDLKGPEGDAVLARASAQLKGNPRDEEALRARCEVHVERNEFEKAIKDLDVLLQIHPKQADLLRQRAQAKHLRGNYTGALEDCNQAIDADPSQAQGYHLRGVVSTAMENLESALRDFDQALLLNPEFDEAYVSRAQALRAMGHPQKSIDGCSIALRINPKNDEAYHARGMAYKAMGNYQDALADYNQAIKLNPTVDSRFYDRALVQFKVGHLEESIRDFSEAIALNPDHEMAYHNRGCTFIQKRDFDSCIRDFTKAIALNATNEKAFYNRAYAFIEKGNFDNAIA